MMKMIFIVSLFFSLAAHAQTTQNCESMMTQEEQAYQQWIEMTQGQACEFTPECEQGENCMDGNYCSRSKCDDTHKCVVGESCEQGFCHI